MILIPFSANEKLLTNAEVSKKYKRIYWSVVIEDAIIIKCQGKYCKCQQTRLKYLSKLTEMLVKFKTSFDQC